jgi:hypothetical protein
MKLEVQTRSELNKQRHFNILPFIGIFTGIALVVYTIKQLFSEEEEGPDKLPPIIIKSGSLVIETDVPLKPDSPGQPAYRRESFGKIRGIRVVRYKEKKKKSEADDFYETSDWNSTKDVQVNINLQYCQQEQNGDCVSWSAGPTINIFNSNNDFEVTTPIKLSASKPKNHPKRKAKREDEGVAQAFRFGSVEIRERIGGSLIKQYPVEDGWEYIIAFYNELDS